MSVVHTWAIMLGVLALAIPLAVHWLTRPRPLSMPLSTIRFVLEAVQQRRTRHRLRDFIILLLRGLAIAALATAIARPYFGETTEAVDTTEGDVVRVVVLDASQSTLATDAGVSLFERGRSLAADRLRYRPGMHANLIVATNRAQVVFEQPSSNFEALREELARTEAQPQRFDVNSALEVAAEQLAPRAEEDTRRRELIVISDFQRSNWVTADFSVLPVDTDVQLESIAAESPLDNIAVLGATFRGRVSARRDVPLEIEIGNFTDTPRQVTVEVKIGNATFRIEGHCPAAQRTTLSESIRLRQPGWQTGHVRLLDVQDALSIDNLRPLSVRVRQQPVYALITRQSAGRAGSSSHYLQCALVPDARPEDAAATRVERIDPEAIDRQGLAAADLIVIDHCGKLSEESIGLLGAMLRRGRPIVYVAGELIDATNLRRLTDAAGGGLKMPVEFLPPPADRARHNLFLTSVRSDRIPFRVFGDRLNSVTGQLRFSGGLLSRQLEDGLADDVLATFGDGSAFLVLTTADLGALAVMNADLSASNLPVTDAFVPILEELVQAMLQRRSAEQKVICGEPLVAQLPAEAGNAEGLRLHAPNHPEPDNEDQAAAGRWGSLRDEATGVVWSWINPNTPGAYRVEREGQTVFAISVVPPTNESRLETLAADVLKERLGAGRHIEFHHAGMGTQEDDTMWTWLLAGCVLFLLAELSALIGFRV